jgi:hypothetical protein
MTAPTRVQRYVRQACSLQDEQPHPLDQIERDNGVLRHIRQNDGFLNGNRDKGDTIKVRQNQFALAGHPTPL